MKLGIIKPDFPGEKRVALLPDDMIGSANQLVIEDVFGKSLGISTDKYIAKGATIAPREAIFNGCDAIFSLKIIQPADFEKLREHQIIIGWTHPYDSPARPFMELAREKSLTIVDLDNIHPAIFYRDKVIPIPFIPKNFIWKNSFWAGYASVQHALLNFGLIPNSDTVAAVLSPGNTAQGAYNALSKFSCDTRMYYRKTISEFLEEIDTFDIIVNGIEVASQNEHIITRHDLTRVKKGCLFIDSAANADGAIEGTRYTTIEQPIYTESGLYFYEVDNVPSIYFRTISKYISKILSHYIFSPSIRRLIDLRDNSLTFKKNTL